MRSEHRRSEGLFSYVGLEAQIPADHPLRPICDLVDAALRELPPTFSGLCARRAAFDPNGAAAARAAAAGVAAPEATLPVSGPLAKYGGAPPAVLQDLVLEGDDPLLFRPP